MLHQLIPQILGLTVERFMQRYAQQEVKRVGPHGGACGQEIRAVVDGGEHGTVLLVALTGGGVGQGSRAAAGGLDSSDKDVLGQEEGGVEGK